MSTGDYDVTITCKFWDGTEHTCEIMPNTDIFTAELECLSDLAHRGTFKDMIDIKDSHINK